MSAKPYRGVTTTGIVHVAWGRNEREARRHAWRTHRYVYTGAPLTDVYEEQRAKDPNA